MNEISPRLIDQIIRHDFNAFVQRTFQTVAPGAPYLDNWHIWAMGHHLRLCAEGKIKRLIITLPPRSGKSITVSVAFVAWLLGVDPTKQIICASYAKDLANKHSRDTRAVMLSEWYRRAFPRTIFDPTKVKEDEFYTTERGFRMAVSIEGALTGFGGDFIIIDDSLKPDEAYSDPARTRVNDWLGNTVLSRLNNKKDGVIIIVQQRVHEDDLVGNQLEKNPDGWVHLDLPAITPEARKVRLGDDWWHDWAAGEALHPERESLEQLEAIRATMGSAAFATQYLQAPAPRDGVMINPAWFGRYERHQLPAKFDQVVQSWDTANKPTELSDYSVCTTWGLAGSQIYLLHVLRKRLDYPDLKRAVHQQAQDHQASVILIEDHGSGTSLIQDLKHERVHGVTGIKPDKDKVMRLHAQTGTIENGLVHLPTSASWLDCYLLELTTFPNAKFDDQVDSTSQALGWIKIEGREPAIITYYRELVEELKHPKAEPFLVLIAPEGVTHVTTQLGRCVSVGPERRISVTETEARPLRLCGWIDAP
ncbi:MAG: phage terminase large subunit [Alphaproteobacteria bacterium]